MSLITNTLQTVLTADVTKYTSGLNKASAGLSDLINKNRTLGDATKNLLKGFASINPVTALAAAGIGAVGAAAAGVARQAVALGDELFRVSERTGVAVESLSTLKFAAEQSNASFSDVQTGLRFLARNADAAARGNDKAAAAFDRLGVKVKGTNGQLKPADELFREIADSVSKMGNANEKTAASAALLGRSAGPALVPLLNQGKAGIEALEAEAAAFGVRISSGFARESDTFNDNLKKIKDLGVGFGLVIADNLLPGLNDLLEAMQDIGKEALPKFVKFMDDAKFRTFQFATALNIAIAGVISFGANAVGATDTAKEYNAVIAAGLEMLKLTKEEFTAEEEARRKSKETTKDQTKETREFTSSLKELNEQLADATNPDVTAIVSLSQSLREMGLEGAAAYDTLISKLREFSAAGDSQAQLALDRIQKIMDAELRAISEVADADRRAAEQAAAEHRPFGAEGGQIGPAEEPRRPREGEEGFIGPLSEEAFLRAGGDARETLDENAGLIEKAAASQRVLTEEAERTNDAFEEGQQIFAGLTNLAGGFADALVETAEGGKLAFQDFFKGLLKDLARAIVRATILQAILGLFGGGFSIAAIGKAVQSALGLGGQGFQEEGDSSILGRTAQSRALPGGIIGNPAVATPVAMPAARPAVMVYEPGPFTRVEVADKWVAPRMRERQRRLNEEPF